MRRTGGLRQLQRGIFRTERAAFCVGTAAPAVQASAARRGCRLPILALKGVAGLRPADSRGRLSLRNMRTQTDARIFGTPLLGTIGRCRNLLDPHFPDTLLKTPAPGSITISRKLKPGRISFPDMKLLWMIPNLRPSAQRRDCLTSATS